MSLSMTQPEREAFLADVHIGVISIEQADAAPLSAPIWYDYRPDTGIWVITEKGSLKGLALAAAERFTIVAQTEQPPFYRYVSVSGPVVSVRPADLEKDSRPMAHRYFGRELGDQYVSQPSTGEALVFTMQPGRWRTVDYSKLQPDAGP